MLRSVSRLAVISWRCSGRTIKNLPLTAKCWEIDFVRYRHVTSGIQGRRNSKVKPRKYVPEDDVEGVEEDGAELQEK